MQRSIVPFKYALTSARSQKSLKARNVPNHSFTMLDPAKILFLHGKQQDAEIFSQRIAWLVKKLQRNSTGLLVDRPIQCVFVDAPFTLPLREGDSVPMRTWAVYQGSSESPHCDWSPAIAAIDSAWENQGPFVGLVAFSQGNAAAAAWLKHRFLERMETPNFAVCGSAVHPLTCEPFLLDMPSLHIIGENDTAVAPSRSQAFAEDWFVDPKIHLHPGRHQIATSVSQPLLDFILQHVPRHTADTEGDCTKKGDCSTVPEHQSDELESLEAIFASDFEIVSYAPLLVKIQLRDLDLGDEVTSDEPALLFTLPATYPESDAPLIRVEGLTALLQQNARTAPVMQRHMQEHLVRCAGDDYAGAEALFQLVEEGKSWLQEHISEYRSLSAGPAASTARAGTAEDSAESARPTAASLPVQADLNGDDPTATALHRECMEAATTQALLEAARAPPPSVSKRGVWDYCVGLVGKPSAGKSTFFNAVTKSNQAKMAAYPFTTIDANVGMGFFATPCPSHHIGASAASSGGSDSARAAIAPVTPVDGWCPVDAATGPAHTQVPKRNVVAVASPDNGTRHGDTAHKCPTPPRCRRRLQRTRIKDVAGLVPGAYMGLGCGNAFLNDLLDADVLVHVLDGSGTTDRGGVAVDGAGTKDGASDPASDVAWIRDELHYWVYSNVAAKWDAIRSRPHKFLAMFTGYHCREDVVVEALRRAGYTMRTVFDEIPAFGAREVHRVVANFLCIRFPMLLLLNKMDKAGSIENINKTQHAHPTHPIAVVSAKAELDLTAWHNAGIVQFDQVCGQVHVETEGAAWESLAADKRARVQAAVDAYRTTVLSPFGSTGIMEAISAAVHLKPPVVVYPVVSLDTLQSVPMLAATSKTKPGVLSESVLMYPGSTVEDLYVALKNRGAVTGDFVRAEALVVVADRAPDSAAFAGEHVAKHPVRKDDTLSSYPLGVFCIMTNRKVAWQHQHHSGPPPKS
eukprot:m.1386560 g.1386560  ORF g.1386560 m.1386560 type:complete len:971 (-) comp24976_c0_seq2:3936-6848(-)